MNNTHEAHTAALQKGLNALGIGHFKETGHYGKYTHAAVHTFKERHPEAANLEGDALLAAVKLAVEKHITALIQSEKPISHSQVKQLQKGLNLLGCHAGPEDGIAYEKTGAGIIAFAKTHSEIGEGKGVAADAVKRAHQEEQKKHHNLAAASAALGIPTPPSTTIDITVPALSSSVIVLDSGHGKKDEEGGVFFGARVKGTEEYKVNTAITDLVKQKLEQRGFTVHLTSERPLNAPTLKDDLASRALFADQQNAALFVSIHANECHRASAHGAQIYTYKNTKTGTIAPQISQQFAEIMRHSMEAPDKHEDSFAVLSPHVHKHRPAILVETGFLSNKKDRKTLTCPEGQEAVADKIAAGIIRYAEAAGIPHTPPSTEVAHKSYGTTHPLDTPSTTASSETIVR